jgi:hypothetical protein
MPLYFPCSLLIDRDCPDATALMQSYDQFNSWQYKRRKFLNIYCETCALNCKMGENFLFFSHNFPSFSNRIKNTMHLIELNINLIKKFINPQ